MLRKSILLVLAVATVAITACDAVTEQLVPTQEIVATNPNLVSLSKAMTVANHYVQDKGISIPTKAKGLEVKNSFTLDDSEDLPVLHTINYEGGGFVIVSGDNRTYPVLAYSEDGYLPQDLDSYPGGLKIWIEEICGEINYLRNNSNETDSLSKYIWERFEKENPGTRSQPADTEYWSLSLSHKL